MSNELVANFTLKQSTRRSNITSDYTLRISVAKMQVCCRMIYVLLQSLFFLVIIVCGVDHCPNSVHPSAGRCKIDCLLNAQCERWQYCCKTGCRQTCVNYTTCQLQKIEAALMRRGFSPACNPDGSFREIQCTTRTPLKCWRVNAQGEKIQETDVTIKFSSNSERHQPQASKRKPRNVRQYPNLEEDEMDENPSKKEKTRCHRMRERRLRKRKNNPGVFVPKCKSNGHFRVLQCNRKTKACWCVDRQGKQIQGTRIRGGGKPKCRTSTVTRDCGKRWGLYNPRSRRIVGGQESVPNSWPWMSALFFNRTKLTCGATIIKPSWVVTAAHCFNEQTSKKPSDWEVHIGEHSLHREEGKEQKLDVKQILIHPNYKPSNSSHPGDNDIALVRMAGSLKFGSHVSKICLPESFNYFQAGKRCIVTGWGHTYWQGSSSPVLREAWVDLVGKEGCNSPRSYNGAVGGNFLCAGFKEGGTDKCSYDSGGPLACPDPSGDGTWMLAGIVSWGERCALPYKYGVYTNVNEYTQWMEANLKIDR